jgi:(1->4)-alpha-D-glucan 1-alpha-D-glucosylmutase
VIEYGQQSRYFRYFDIDGSRPLTLPFLGDTFEAELEKGAITLKRDPVTEKAALVYYDTDIRSTRARTARIRALPNCTKRKAGG